jgi:hypothetical protein
MLTLKGSEVPLHLRRHQKWSSTSLSCILVPSALLVIMFNPPMQLSSCPYLPGVVVRTSTFHCNLLLAVSARSTAPLLILPCFIQLIIKAKGKQVDRTRKTSKASTSTHSEHTHHTPMQGIDHTLLTNAWDPHKSIRCQHYPSTY